MRFLIVASLLLLSTAGYSQQKEKVTLSTATGNVYGTLTLPSNVKGAVPLVIFIVGSGPTNRDGNQINLQNNSHLYLADSLAKRGIASVRYDKRGIGESKPAAPDETGIRFDFYVDDAVEWVKKYSKDKRFTRTYIAGHSEGSLIGILAAQRAPVAGLVSIAGVAMPADSIIFRQLEAAPTVPRSLVDSMRMYFGMLRKDGHASNIPPGLYQSLLRESVQPYLLSWLKYNPSEEIVKLKIPVLVVQGTTDLQVDTTQARMLAALAPNSKLVIIPGMNHVLKQTTADMQDNQEAYIMPDRPVDQQLVKSMSSFILGSGKKKS